jgi:hypothetical protein
MPRPCRNLAGLLLVATLLTPWAASAAPLSPDKPRTASPALEQSFWNLLTGLWAEAGCILDPSGGPCVGAQSIAAPPVFPDAGCGIDPSGGCGSSH